MHVFICIGGHKLKLKSYKLLVNVVQINHIQAPLIWFIFRELFQNPFDMQKTVCKKKKALIRRLCNAFCRRGGEADRRVFIEKLNDISPGG